MPPDASIPAYMSFAVVKYLTPEIILIAVATVIYVAGAMVRARELWSYLGFTGILAAAYALWTSPEATGGLGPVLADDLANYVRWLSLVVGGLMVLMMSRFSFKAAASEMVGTLLMICAGLMLVASSGELVLMFLGLELVTFPTYLLLYLGRDDAHGQESAAKYFYLSILAAALMLYGFSFLYGVAGSTQLADLAKVLGAQRDLLSAADGPMAKSTAQQIAGLGLVFLFAGLGFKLTAVPFHFYAPDVYQGTTHPIAGLLSVAPKIAGVVALLRIVGAAMPEMEPFAWRVVLILAVLTMTLGNVIALWQENLRRMLAYSSIAHAGYLMVGLAAGFAAQGVANSAEPAAIGLDGFGATLLYLAVYALATLGTFAALTYLGGATLGDDAGEPIENVEQLAGLARRRPLAASAIAVFMFSLAGIPPLAGFWGKFSLFTSALAVDGGTEFPGLGNWFIALAVIGMLNAAIAAAYYLRIIATMYFKPLEKEPAGQGGPGASLAMTLCAMAVLVIGIMPGQLMTRSREASAALKFKTPAPVATVAETGR
ncbi:MAG: NADH-quinone oxidoreductase subunit N [Planctomycetia bacterium]|nr:NADH-quinone oxidoreductase subunit N [Planctomycetia bacterium]